MTWKISDVMEPNFDGALLENRFIRGSLFIVNNITQRNNIGPLYRLKNDSTTTMCYVVADGLFYELVNDTNAAVTSNDDWQVVQIASSQAVVPVGEWNAVTNNVVDTNQPLTDLDAENANGNFYYPVGIIGTTNIQHDGLFRDQNVAISPGDWIISVGSYWTVSRQSAQWETLNRPQSIVDYENGIVQFHTQEISTIVGLTTALDQKYDVSNLAEQDKGPGDQPSDRLVSLFYLDSYAYAKDLTYTREQVDALLANVVNGDIDFDWNRPVRRLPSLGDVPGGSKLSEGIDSLFYGQIDLTARVVSLTSVEIGVSTAPVLTGEVVNNDAESVTSISVVDQNDVVVGVVPPTPGATSFAQTLTAITAIENDTTTYRVRVQGRYVAADPTTAFTIFSDEITVNPVYPILYGVGTGLTDSTYYSALTKLVVPQSNQEVIYGSADETLYYLIPDAYDLLESIKDSAGNEVLNTLFSSPSVASITTPSGIVDYKVYTSAYTISLTNEVITFLATAGIINTTDNLPEGTDNLYVTPTQRQKLNEFPSPGDIGNMFKAVYDAGDNGIVDRATSIVLYARNDSGSIITRGTLINITEIVPGVGATIIPADKDSDLDGNGIADEDILAGEFGNVIREGAFGGWNTAAYSIGDFIYLGANGTIEYVNPPSSGLVQIVGLVAHVDGSDGILFVNPTRRTTLFPKVADWQSFTSYQKNAVVFYVDGTTHAIFRAVTTHTSTGNFLTDLTGGLWEAITGDMLSIFYDPTDKRLDVYDMDSMDESPTRKILTDVERTKLAGLEDPRYKGIFADPTALQTAYPLANEGDSADVISTSSTWTWVAGGTNAWVDSGIPIGGDMQSAIYDPTSVSGDAFSMDNMVEGGTNKIFSDVERTKLANIEANAQVNPNALETKTAYESNSNTNAFTDTEQSKLAAIEAGAQINPDDATIKTQYENNADTNAFTDAEQTKLGSITAGADMLKSVYDPNDNGIVNKAGDLVVEAINDSGGTITAGTVVYISSTDAGGKRFNQASNDVPSSIPVAGVLEADTDDGDLGIIVAVGVVELPNLPGITVGDKLYLGLNGEIVNVPPAASDTVTTVLLGTLVGRVGIVDYVELLAFIGLPADTASYDNTTSGLIAENVQEAVDELAGLMIAFEQTYFEAGPLTTTLTTPQTALSENIDIPEDADYLVEVTYGWNHDDGGSDFEGIVTVDGTIMANPFGNGFTHKQEPQDVGGTGGGSGTDQQYGFAMREVFPLTTGLKTITVEYATSSAGDESTIWNIVVNVKKI